MAKLLNSIKAIGNDRSTKGDQPSPFHLPDLERPYEFKEVVQEKYVLYTININTYEYIFYSIDNKNKLFFSDSFSSVVVGYSLLVYIMINLLIIWEQGLFLLSIKYY